VEISSVAKRYARSLHAYAVEENAKDAVRADCVAIRQLMDRSQEFSNFVANPTLPPDVADRAVSALFKEKSDAVTLRFLRFLISKSRLTQLRGICDAYEQYSCEEQGVIKVKITAAHELSDTQLAAMTQKLHARYNKTIDAEVKVDPSLIGGFKIQVGDHIRDLSMVSKLDQFEQGVINAKHRHTLRREFLVKREPS
jgi:F-type H+-transporting ATPase subunit delta